MNIKEFLKPTLFKIFIFMFIGTFYIYLAKESVCAAGLFFAFCYNAYGFPFSYLITGSSDAAAGHIKTLPFGEFFSKTDNYLLNPLALFLDAILIYLLSCFVANLLKSKN